jgi:hypothetical protein
MDETQWWLIDVVGAAILGLLLLWLVMKTRGRKKDDQIAEQGTRELYAEEEQRRRDGTDDL